MYVLLSYKLVNLSIFLGLTSSQLVDFLQQRFSVVAACNNATVSILIWCCDSSRTTFELLFWIQCVSISLYVL